jgi:hypothetical protein
MVVWGILEGSGGIEQLTLGLGRVLHTQVECECECNELRLGVK